MKKKYALFLIAACCTFLTAGAQVTQKMLNAFLNDTAVSTGHAGVGIYDVASGQYLCDYNAGKNFIPASNVKLFSLYAGMKYLGDSLVGLRYKKINNKTIIFPAGDPSFLHADFKTQRVYDFLQKQDSIELQSTLPVNPLGTGWVWNDYLDDYMVQRSTFPVYANLISIAVSKNGLAVTPPSIKADTLAYTEGNRDYTFRRGWDNNDLHFYTNSTEKKKGKYELPLVTDNNKVIQFLADTLHKPIVLRTKADTGSYKNLSVVFSQPADSMYKIMMSRSDNFFAEQTLLMASNEHLGFMSDEAMIDTLLKKDFMDIPTKPRWVDGCGLSRYDLFSPKDFIYLLLKMKNEFGWQRVKNILTTGGQGTLTGYYEKDAGFIYAKTGSMSNVVALSGYLITPKNKTLVFSVLLNNFEGSGRAGRRAIEKFLQAVRQNN